MLLAGVDIGGTKCAASLGRTDGNGNITLLSKEKFATGQPSESLEKFKALLTEMAKGEKIDGIGISCGNPMDTKRGVILSPPNLPGWDEVYVVKYFEEAFGCPGVLQNDANACAFAEYKFGAGRGYSNVIFLTFGTGFGAGLILDGRLYSGTNDNAGEIGHVRLTENGPVGYGKAGSVEGYCSGGGIALLARAMVKERLDEGDLVSFCKDESKINELTAKSVADAAYGGDGLAKQIYSESGKRLGQALSILIDVINPEVIIIGSIFSRSRELLWDECEKVIRREVLPQSYDVCRVVKSGLGENIGDYAALALALKAVEESGGK